MRTTSHRVMLLLLPGFADGRRKLFLRLCGFVRRAVSLNVLICPSIITDLILSIIYFVFSREADCTQFNWIKDNGLEVLQTN